MNVLILGNVQKIEFENNKSNEIKQYSYNNVQNARNSIGNLEFDVIVKNYSENESQWNEFVSELKTKRNNMIITDVEGCLSLEKFPRHDFHKINIKRLLNHNMIPVDIYTLIADIKCLKIISANNLFSKEQLDNAIKKHVKWLYVKKDEYKYLKSYLYHTVECSFKSKIKQNPKDVLHVEIDKNEFVNKMLADLNISEQLRNSFNKSSYKTIENISKHSALKKHLETYSKSGKYLISHSIMISHITSLVAHIMSWSAESTMHKLSMSAFLHDMTFTDDNIAKIDTLEMAKEKYSEYLSEIQMHPIHISRMLENIPSICPCIDKIVLNHHEKPDGSGFPRKLSSELITQIEAIFIMSHDFVDSVFDKKIDDKLTHKILNEFESKYNVGNFKIPLKAFQKILEKKVNEREIE